MYYTVYLINDYYLYTIYEYDMMVYKSMSIIIIITI